MYSVEKIYESLMGDLVEPVPGVENAFSVGSRCAVLYEQVYASKQRLCDRLGIEEDEDVEELIDCLLEISRELSIKMYSYGVQNM